MEDDNSRDNPGGDSVDFAAAATAVLRVPSPSLSSRSFEDSPRSDSDDNKMLKGDREEEAELQRALQLSETGQQDGVYLLTANGNNELISFDQVEGPTSQGSVPVVVSTEHIVTNDSHGSLSNGNTTPISFGNPAEEILFSPLKADQINHVEQSVCPDRGVSELSSNTSHSEKVENQSGSGLHVHGQTELSRHGADEVSHLSPSNPGTDSSSGLMQNMDVTEPYSPSVDGSEPIYEGEECILDSGTPKFADGEPVYEGEVILAEQGDNSVGSKDGLSPQQGELIRNFLKNSASQLTFYGLFRLQDGLKERELCVFFRNNHFSTMFKLKGELYLLATDQGYLNQHDLVWEKLNQVNGDTLFMTYNFREFKVESPSNETWDEQNVMASTAVCL
ncbi:Ubiquitin carboxyl-terminal hydrolase MINDY-2 [Linum perenne]